MCFPCFSGEGEGGLFISLKGSVFTQLLLTSSVVLQKTNSVEKALELLVGKEEVVGGSCPQSQSSQDAVYTQTSLEEMPLILMLHLKCFHYKLQTCSKIIKTVEFPIDLRIDSSTSQSKIALLLKIIEIRQIIVFF